MRLPGHIVDHHTANAGPTNDTGSEPPPLAALSIDESQTPTTHRFCRDCGAPWDHNQDQCPCCQQRAAQQAVLLHHADDSKGVTGAIALYFSLLAVCVAGIIAGRVMSYSPRHEVDIELWATVGITAVTLVWAIVDHRIVVPPLLTAPNPLWIAGAIGLSLVTFTIATSVIYGFTRLVAPHGPGTLDPFITTGYGWGFVISCVCVEPAIIEELAFRGIIFGRMSRVLNPTETVLVTALMFMTLHLSPVRFPHTLALGLAAGFLRTRTKSLYPCMALHFAHNLLCVGAQRFHWFT